MALHAFERPRPKANTNVLLALNKLSDSEENFLTEAFCHLLEHLRSSHSKGFSSVIDLLTSRRVIVAEGNQAHFNVATQVTAGNDTPDIVISGPHSRVIIEVKDQSPVDVPQLRRYSKLLEAGPESQKCLVLLTRWVSPDVHVRWLAPPVRWSAVDRRLEEVSDYCGNPITAFLISQFREFLEGKGMALAKVGWELTPGVRALANLRHALIECLAKHGYRSAGGAEAEAIGIYFSPIAREKKYWVGVLLDKPGLLTFAAHESVAQPVKASWEDTGEDWYHKYLDLESEEVHFFSRSTGSQTSRIDQFLDECLGDCGLPLAMKPQTSSNANRV